MLLIGYFEGIGRGHIELDVAYELQRETDLGGAFGEDAGAVAAQEAQVDAVRGDCRWRFDHGVVIVTVAVIIIGQGGRHGEGVALSNSDHSPECHTVK